MPTEAKHNIIEQLADRIRRSTIAIATGFEGLSSNQMTDLRKRLRDQGIELSVVKNRLALLAAQQAEDSVFPEILSGTTAVAFGYDDVVTVARTLDEYVKSTRAELVIRNGVMGGRLISNSQVSELATLPTRDVLIAKLLGQMKAPTSGLVNVLVGPLRGLTTVLQRRAEVLGGSGGG
jgi:large subunit ribosomal protein L10